MLAFLQLDAAGEEAIERLLAQGRMPALRELLERGSRLPLEHTTGLMFEASIYPSLYSGEPAADHGLYYPFMWDQQRMRVGYMDHFARPSNVWERLAAEGARSLVLDPYAGWANQGAEGAWFSGWQYEHKLIPKWGAPRAEYRRAARRFGSPRTLVDVSGLRTPGEALAMREVILEGPARLERAAVDLLGRESFDFAWITFIAVHHAGHHFWEMPRLSSDPTPEERRLLETALDDIYERCDAALGRIVEALPAGAEVIVLSPIGMGPNTAMSDLLPEMVGRVLGADGGERSDDAGAGIWRYRERMPSSPRRAANRILPGSAVREILARVYTRGIDWGETRAFSLPGDHFGYLRLNLRGRERDGIVEPEDAEALLDELTDGLLTFTDDDGERSIARIRRPHAELAGKPTEGLPDLVAEWSERPTSDLAGITSPRFGRIARRGVGPGRTGNHNDRSWVVLPRIGLSGGGDEPPPNTIDLAATACARLGLETELKGRDLLAASAR